MSQSEKNTMNKPSAPKTNQAWGGRFNEPVDEFVARFTASVNFDQRFYRQDIQGSIAHAKMLCEADVLTADERDQIINGLQEIEAQIESGEFVWSVPLEDVHMNIEAALTEKSVSSAKNYIPDAHATIR